MPTTQRVSPAVSRPETILGPCTPMKHNPPRPSTMARTNMIMREPLREYIHEYIATTPQYDKQGHQIFPTYYQQDSKGLMPFYCVKAIGRGQPQNSMHQQVVAGYDYQRLNPNVECFAKCTTMTHQQNQPPQNGTNCAYTASGQQLPLNLSMPLATCDRCAIDHLFVQCPLRLTMPKPHVIGAL